jgi:MULE transposase domain/SWIM zinc finger
MLKSRRIGSASTVMRSLGQAHLPFSFPILKLRLLFTMYVFIATSNLIAAFVPISLYLSFSIASTMDIDIYNSIEQLSLQHNSWEPEEILIPSRDGSFVDLMDYIGENPFIKKNTVCLLPVNATAIEKDILAERQRVIEFFSEPCAKAGFPIVIESWDWRYDRINVTCKRGAMHNGDNNKGIRKTFTNRPTCKEDRCPFRFNIYWIKSDNCWGLKAGHGVRHHHGHVRLEKENVKVLGTRAIPREARDFCIDSLRSNANPGTLKAFVKQKYNVTISSSTLEYWRQLANPRRGEHATAASSLLQSLRDAGDISYVALYDDPSSSLLHVRRPRNAGRLQSTMHASGVAEETTVVDSVLNADPLAVDYSLRSRNSMCLEDGQKMLLAIAFNSNQDRRFSAINPEVLAADVTEQTNSEKRPLMMLAGLTGNNETFTLCRAFLPSQQRWVMDWFFRVAVPFLLPPGTLTRNRMMLTDGDEKEYNAFLAALDEHYPNSRHHLCTWHLLDRGLRRTPIMALCDQKYMCYDGTVCFKAVKLWIQSWFSTIETVKEYEYSFGKLHEWLREEEVVACMGTQVPDLIVNFILEKLTPHEQKWLFAHFIYRWTFDRQSSQIVEVENSAMKRSGSGPKPFHSIATAACSMILYQDLRNGEKSLRAANALSKRSSSAAPNDIDKYLNDYCVAQVVEQSDAAANYEVYRFSDSVFYVKRKPSPEPPVFDAYNLNPTRPRESDEVKNRAATFFVPKFDRTRVVSVIAAMNKQYLKCTCGLFERHGFPCRHIYAAMKRHPMSFDVIPRYHKAYESYYQKDEAFTEYFNKQLRNELPGPPIEASEILQTQISPCIPTRITATLPDEEPVPSSTCKWGICPVNVGPVNVVPAGGPETETTEHTITQPRLELEFSLSQTAYDPHEENGVDDDDDCVADDGDDFAVNIGEYDEDDASVEVGMNINASSASERRPHPTPKRNRMTFYQNITPYVEEMSKMAEWGTEYAMMMEEGIYEVFERTRKKYADDQRKKNPKFLANKNTVVSSHMEARGPRKAKRLKPAGSPSK